ncbi:hypothetical protein PoB_004239800 [Plakobranchus ocellatus]|uniref:Uncharacterized protein n=1 Tax=Plakobranchus ocellatus TaxID=259542 RepID=A0AAV4B8H6_9GAST|nr:hypothetical protein PoB_004239800 [Plakobranchus ocellatus]
MYGLKSGTRLILIQRFHNGNAEIGVLKLYFQNKDTSLGSQRRIIAILVQSACAGSAIELACARCYYLRSGTCLVLALIDDPRCGRYIITKSQSPKFTGGLGAAWLGRVN